ncbi:rhodanese-like domain-containing protein [Actinokineospora soli]|uniref:Rhodanese-like domain-containing protein n=1 Tax=Actinokineospora soli TaxID=1048753 RepID=A0ABW2TI07_9PSEU
MTAVNRVQPAAPTDAIAHFAAKLAFETDVSDVHADLEAGVPGLVVVDSRSRESWDEGHVPGALHLPTAEIAARARPRCLRGRSSSPTAGARAATGPRAPPWSSPGSATA